MIDLTETMRVIAANGERSAAERSSSTRADEVVALVRSRQRRRRAAAAGGVAAAVALVLAVLAPVLLRTPAEPAVPGQREWQVQMGAESWSAPALVDELVVAGANDGVVRAFTLEGDAVWEFSTGAAVRAPVAAGEGIALIHSDDGTVYALDRSGELRWATPIEEPVRTRPEYDEYSSGPLVADGIVVVGTREGAVVALDEATGEERWRAQTDGAVSTTAATDGELAFVGSQDGHVYGLDLDTGAERWRTELGSPILSSPAASDGVVVSGSRGTVIVGMDAATGREEWFVGTGQSWAESSVDTAAGIAYLGSSAAGEVLAVDLETGIVQWRTGVGGWPWARPTAAGDRIYATAGSPDGDADASAMHALDRSTGAVVWTAPGGPALNWSPQGPGAGAMTAPLITERLVIVAGLDGSLTAWGR